MQIQLLDKTGDLVLSRAKVGMPAWLGLLLATACGLIAANIYYAQPLVGPISTALHLSPRAAGLIATMTQVGYGVGLLLVTPILRRRALCHACLFGAFGLFWTAVPLQLAGRYHLSQNGIALFALVGVTGAIAAPLAGRMADRGWSKPTTALAMSSIGAALLLGLLGSSAPNSGLLILAVAAILLDFGVAANGVLGQRAIYALDAAARGRLNGIYMATFFGGGAIGSALGGWSYAEGGWPLTMATGLLLPVLALAYFLTEASELQP